MKAGGAGVRVALPRTGVVLAQGGGALQAMLPPFKMGVGGPLGSGRQWWSWISREDLIGIILHALDNDMRGAVNATAPSPERQKDFARILGRVLGRPAIIPAPAFALKILLGGFAIELLSSKRVLPEAAQAAGYRFQHPDLEAALRSALKR